MSVIEQLRQTVKDRVRALTTPEAPRDRGTYIGQCVDRIAEFRGQYPYHWIEYIRRERPSDFEELWDLKLWLGSDAPRAALVPETWAAAQKLVDRALGTCRHPRGVIVGVMVDGSFHVGYSLCNLTAGDRWNRYIGLSKAIARGLALKPCPSVKCHVDEERPKFAGAQFVMHDLIAWIEQFPPSARRPAVRLASRVFKQHLVTTPVHDLLPALI